MGAVLELGPGVRNIHKYGKIYFGSDPEIIEEDIFKTIIPLNSEATPQVTPQDNPQVDQRSNDLINFCREPKSRRELQEFLKARLNKKLGFKVLLLFFSK